MSTALHEVAFDIPLPDLQPGAEYRAVFETPYLEELLTPSEVLTAPSVLQINTLPFLHSLSRDNGKLPTLDQLSDKTLQQLSQGHQYVWMMGLFERGQRITALKYQDEYCYTLPDLDPSTDVVSSPFAIYSTDPNPEIVASWQQWESFRQRLKEFGAGTILDFVPYQSALCHPDVGNHPQYYLTAPQQLLERIGEFNEGAMRQFSRNLITVNGEKQYVALAKDGACMPPWIDCLQHNLANPQFQEKAMADALKVAQHCDGFRWDMAQLSLSRRFLEYWGWLLTGEQQKWLIDHPFVPRMAQALKYATAKEGRSFSLLGEAYDHRDLYELGSHLDGLYAEGLYKTLIQAVFSGYAREKVMPMLRALNEGYYGSKPVVFSQNHDTQTAISTFGSKEAAMAVGVITTLIPRSYLLFQDGQELGRKYKLPMQVNRYPPDEYDLDKRSALPMEQIYANLKALRKSRLWQQGIPSTPEIYQVGLFNISQNVVTQQMDLPGIGGAVVCTNLGGLHYGEGKLYLPGNRKVSIFDVMQNRWLSQGQISYPDEHNFITVHLEPWQSQIIFYSYPE